MYEILQMEFNMGIFDANGLIQFVGYGSITADQYKQITGVDYVAPQQPAAQTPNAQ